MSDKKTKITVKVRQMHEAGTGHRQRPGRAGFHEHRATKRNRTRSDQNRRALEV